MYKRYKMLLLAILIAVLIGAYLLAANTTNDTTAGIRELLTTQPTRIMQTLQAETTTP